MSTSNTIVVAQCTASKRDGTHRAQNLYELSQYFCKQREYAEAAADQWYIQSAKYGLLEPDERVASYDKRARNIDDPDAWASEIAERLDENIPTDATVELLGGKHYIDPLTPQLEARGFEVVEPLRGLGIGECMSKLMELTKEARHASLPR